MINLGIVISVAEYSGELKSLPGCHKDGEAIANVLQYTQRFHDVLVINNSSGKDNTISKEVKSKLVEFVGNHKGKEIGEVFFYFSGHGDYSDNEFFYLMSDYQSAHKNRTSLQNSELDSLVRSLSPQLFVKVVDACHSGISYVKNSGELEKHFNESRNSFKKLYFMFSSQSDQSSWQDSNLSYFTHSFLSSLVTSEAGAVRYKDIADFVSDDFEIIGVQTPLFVIQADFTEPFCEASASLRDIIGKYGIGGSTSAKANGVSPAILSIADIIREDAKRYSSQEEAFAVLTFIPEFLSAVKLSEDLGGLFAISVETADRDVPGARSIGNWLEKNKSESRYFADVEKSWRTVKKRVLKNPLNSIAKVNAIFGKSNEEDYSYVDTEEPFTEGYSPTVEVPYRYVSIKVEPQTPNLSPVEYFVAPIVSRTNIRLFHAGCHYEYVDWSKRKREGNLEWSTIEAAIKDMEGVKEALNKVVQKFVSYVETPIRTKWSEPKISSLPSEPVKEAKKEAVAPSKKVQ